MSLAVASARSAGLATIASGCVLPRASRRPISTASASPRGASGRSKSPPRGADLLGLRVPDDDQALHVRHRFGERLEDELREHRVADARRRRRGREPLPAAHVRLGPVAVDLVHVQAVDEHRADPVPLLVAVATDHPARDSPGDPRLLPGLLGGGARGGVAVLDDALRDHPALAAGAGHQQHLRRAVLHAHGDHPGLAVPGVRLACALHGLPPARVRAARASAALV